jgi:hypothetical protein
MMMEQKFTLPKINYGHKITNYQKKKMFFHSAGFPPQSNKNIRVFLENISRRIKIVLASATGCQMGLTEIKQCPKSHTMSPYLSERIVVRG